MTSALTAPCCPHSPVRKTCVMRVISSPGVYRKWSLAGSVAVFTIFFLFSQLTPSAYAQGVPLLTGTLIVQPGGPALSPQSQLPVPASDLAGLFYEAGTIQVAASQCDTTTDAVVGDQVVPLDSSQPCYESTFVLNGAAQTYPPDEAQYIYSVLSTCSAGSAYTPTPANPLIDLTTGDLQANTLFSLTPEEQQEGVVAWVPPSCEHWYRDAPLQWTLGGLGAAVAQTTDQTLVISPQIFQGFVNLYCQATLNSSCGGQGNPYFDESLMPAGANCAGGCTLDLRQTIRLLAPTLTVAGYVPPAPPDQDAFFPELGLPQTATKYFDATEAAISFISAGCGSNQYMVLNMNPSGVPGTSPDVIFVNGATRITQAVPECITIPSCPSLTDRLFGADASFANWTSYLENPGGAAFQCQGYTVDTSVAETTGEILDVGFDEEFQIWDGDLINNMFAEDPIVPAGLSFGPQFGTFLGGSLTRASTATSTVSSSADPSVSGEAVTYTAEVTTSSTATATGTMTFVAGGGIIPKCDNLPVDSSGTATCTISYPDPGTHSILASYSGDAQLAPSVSPDWTDQTVVKATPTVSWTAPGSITFGTPLTATQLDATASVPGSFNYSPSAGTVLQPGMNQTLTATFTPTDTTDYNIVSDSTTVTVGFSQPCISIARSGPLQITSGQAICVTSGGTIAGQVTVGPGAALWMNGGVISGPLSSTQASAVTLCEARVTGPLAITGTTGPVALGGSTSCSGNTITGPVKITGNTGGVGFSGNTVSGPLTITGNSGGFTYSGNKLTGPITVSGNS